MPNAVESQIKERISIFMAELDKLVRQSALEAVKGVLDTGGLAARRGRPAGRPMGTARGPGRPKGSGVRRGRRPADLGDATTRIAEYVKANDGQGISAIAAGAGIDLATAKKAATQLLASGILEKSGQRRGTVYHVGSGKPARAAKAKKAGKRRGRKAKKTA